MGLETMCQESVSTTAKPFFQGIEVVRGHVLVHGIL